MAEGDENITERQRKNREALGTVIVSAMNRAASRGRTWMFVEYVQCQKCGSENLIVDNYQEGFTCESCHERMPSGVPSVQMPGELSALHFLESLNEANLKFSEETCGRIEESEFRKMPPKWRIISKSMTAAVVRRILKEVRRGAFSRAELEIKNG